MSKNIQFAIDAANIGHRGQLRKRFRGGIQLPYILHPLEVLKTLWRWGAIDDLTACIAVLHDVLEDTNLSEEDIVSIFEDKTFGEKVKLGVIELTCRDSSQKDEYLKSFGEKSIQSLVVKVADRYCNVNDFLITDPGYAYKYFNKAIAVLETFKDRKWEIDKEWGESVFPNIHAELEELAEKLCKNN